jgi:nucleotide-binding universal stress UspA family protein
MRELNKVLAATDGSSHGLAAVVTGAELARRAGAQIEVATIVEMLLLPPAYAPPGVDAAEFELEFVREAREKARGQAKEAGSPDAPVHVRAGLAPPLINKIALESGADLVVVGADPNPALARSLVGTTGRRVLYLADRPVLVAANARREPYRRIIAAVDLSDETGPVLESASTMARVDGGEVRALFVLEPLPKVMSRMARFREEERLHKAEAEIERLLDAAGLLSEARVERRSARSGNARVRLLRSVDARRHRAVRAEARTSSDARRSTG